MLLINVVFPQNESGELKLFLRGSDNGQIVLFPSNRSVKIEAFTNTVCIIGKYIIDDKFYIVDSMHYAIEMQCGGFLQFNYEESNMCFDSTNILHSCIKEQAINKQAFYLIIKPYKIYFNNGQVVDVPKVANDSSYISDGLLLKNSVYSNEFCEGNTAVYSLDSNTKMSCEEYIKYSKDQHIYYESILKKPAYKISGDYYYRYSHGVKFKMR